MVAPVTEELAAQLVGRVRFAKLNVDDNPPTASRFEVRWCSRAGRDVDRMVGCSPPGPRGSLSRPWLGSTRTEHFHYPWGSFDPVEHKRYGYFFC
jgi:hypothetical protein